MKSRIKLFIVTLVLFISFISVAVTDLVRFVLEYPPIEGASFMVPLIFTLPVIIVFYLVEPIFCFIFKEEN